MVYGVFHMLGGGNKSFNTMNLRNLSKTNFQLVSVHFTSDNKKAKAESTMIHG